MKRILLLFPVLFLLFFTVVHAKDTEQTVDVDFDNVPLKEVVFTLSELTDVSFIFGEQVAALITWIEKDIPLSMVVDKFITVASSVGIGSQVIDSKKNVYSLKSLSKITKGVSGSSVGVIHLNYIESNIVADSIEILYGTSLSLAPFPANNAVVFTGETSLVKDFYTIVKRLDTPKDVDLVSVRLKHIGVKTALNALTMSKVVEDESYYPDYWNRSVIIKGTPYEREMGRVLLSSIDQPQKGWADQVEFVSPEDIDTVVELLNGACPNVEVRKAGADRILISGQSLDVEKASSLIHKVDGSGYQVKVEAVVAYLTDEQFKELGLRLTYEDNTSRYALNDNIVSSLITENTGVLVDWIGEFMGIQIGADQGNGEGEIVSSPVLTVLSGSEASIHVGSEIPYKTKENYNDDDKQTSSSIERKDVGMKFTVKPQVQPDGEFVKIAVTQELSSLADESKLSSDTVDVVFDKQDISSIVLLADGDTVFLGGLKTEQDGKTVSRIPLLSEIPLLGEVFTYEKTTQSKKNLVVSLRVNILEKG